MFCLKLRVLLWKHFIVRRRCFVMTLMELAVPILIILLLRITYTKFSRPSRNAVLPVYRHDPVNLYRSSSINNIYYAPNDTEFVRNLMDDISEKLGLRENDLVGFQNERTLFQIKGKLLQVDQESLAVIFENTADIRNKINYTIRTSKSFQTSKIMPSPMIPGPHENFGQIYYTFVTLQLAIDSSYIERSSNKTIAKELMRQHFPYPPHAKDDFLIIKYDYLLPIFIINAFLFLFLVNISRVLNEKASGMKELMKMMGVPKNLLWLSHYINSMTIQVFVVGAITAVLQSLKTPLIAESNFLIIAISLLIYAHYVTMMSFAFTSIFSKSLIACIVASVLWIVFQLPSGYSIMALKSCFFSVIISACPNILIFWMFKVIGIYEMKGDGLQWSNLFSKPSDEISISFAFTLMMLLVHSLLYGFFTWYVDQVYPGTYGVPKSVFFLFKRDYWCSKQIEPQIDAEEKEGQDPGFFEFDPAAEPGITIDNVWKVYKRWNQTNVEALSGVSFDVYKSGITALLGHNGAGKTTLMSIITGMISPTRGTVKVGGMDTKKNMDRICLSMGVCPQHNLTFSNLTVREHILFFAKIKGVTHTIAAKEIDDILASVKLSDKANMMCSQLSCGMRRRTQLAMALAGKASVLILDEPTSGLDPESRRELWDILLNFRKTHTILISTHSLEEADILADRVVIMNRGRVKCYGTSLFLKKAYGTGYKLYLVLKTFDTSFEIEQSLKNISISFVKTDNIVIFTIPEQNKRDFQKIFTLLEKNKEQWGIDTIGLSSTTLEDVFLRVTSDSEAVGKVDEKDTPRHVEVDTGTPEFTISTLDSYKNRAIGLVEKRLIHTKISIVFYLLQIFFVIFFSGIFIFNTEDSKSIDENPKLSLSLLTYKNFDTHILYSQNDTSQYNFTAFENFYQTRFQQVDDVDAEILEEGMKSIKSYSESIPIALGLYSESYIGLYSTSLYHALPIAVNTFTNLLASQMIPHQNNTPTIFVNNHPIRTKQNDVLDETELNMGKSLISIIIWSSSLTIGAFIMQGIFMPFPINERMSFSRKLQQMTGTGPILYWLITFLYDALICQLITVIVIFIVCLLDPDHTFSLLETFGPLSVHLTCNIFAGLSFVYVLSLLMKNPATGYIFLLIIVVFSMLFSLILFIEGMTMSSSKHNGDIVRCIFRLLPSFSFHQGLLKIGSTASKNAQCLKTADPTIARESLCCDNDDNVDECNGLQNYFSDPEYGIKNELYSFLISTILNMVILLMSEYGISKKALKFLSFTTKQQQDEILERDDDVQKEKCQLVGENSQTAQLALRIEDVAKNYTTIWSRKKIMAVNGVSIGIKRGECFGLLGINGAGKTTIFKMLVGEELPTRGTISGTSNGYCPEFDAVDKFLTGRQVLTLFCRLRGLSKEVTKKEVEEMLNMTGLMKLADVRNGTYSGGNRRKLSVAIALIANQNGVVLLDEPTSGVDPHSRRVLHRALSIARNQGKSIIISSHSMDECEKLCDRLAIMSNGKLACIGNVQHLKKKFGKGVSLTIKLKVPLPEPEGEDEVDSTTPLERASERPIEMNSCNEPLLTLKETIQQTFECELKDENATVLQYHIKNNDGYTNLFSKMEELKFKNAHLLEDYLINDTTLEEVFMFIAKSQRQSENHDDDDK